jgi:hypothetical protein
MDPEQHAHPRSLIRIHAVRLQTLLQEEQLIVNNMAPDQTARTHYVGFVMAQLIYFIKFEIDIKETLIIFKHNKLFFLKIEKTEISSNSFMNLIRCNSQELNP